MLGIILTQNQTFIIGQVAQLLGYIMEGIFFCLDKIGIPNIGLAIILFTIVIYLVMMPLTIKQQKFSKLSAKMNPELQAIQAKYKGKKDSDSSMRMNEETQAVYAKYGVSPTGSCLQLLIQMPILFALYRVIYAMPAYVGKIKEAFFPLVDKLIAQPGSTEFIRELKNANMYSKQFESEAFIGGNVEFVQNTIIDVLNKATTAEWISISDKFPSLAGDVTNTLHTLDRYNNFLGLNIGNSPSYVMTEAISSGAYFMVVAALAIPILSAVTQWINTKLMPQPDANKGNSDNPMASSMKTMNVMMPIMSAFFCFTLPAGMGLYWIAGSVVRSIQQVIINRHIDKIDLDELIKKNVEKKNKKLAKSGKSLSSISNYAAMSTKNVAPKSQVNFSDNINKPSMTQEEKDAAVKKSTEYYSKSAKPGSIASKANMVKQYNEKNNK